MNLIIIPLISFDAGSQEVPSDVGTAKASLSDWSGAIYDHSKLVDTLFVIFDD